MARVRPCCLGLGGLVRLRRLVVGTCLGPVVCSSGGGGGGGFCVLGCSGGVDRREHVGVFVHVHGFLVLRPEHMQVKWVVAEVSLWAFRIPLRAMRGASAAWGGRLPGRCDSDARVSTIWALWKVSMRGFLCEVATWPGGTRGALFPCLWGR